MYGLHDVEHGIDHISDVVGGGPERRKAEDAANKQAAAEEQQNQMLQSALDTARAYDTQQQQLGGQWYDTQTGAARTDDAAHLAALNDLSGNADRMYNELTDNARYNANDYSQAADQASADVSQQYGTAADETRRNLLRYGVNPNSSDFTRFEHQSNLDKAKAAAGAINSGRLSMRQNEKSNLASAISAGLGAKMNANTAALNNRSELLGINDPRIGLPSTELMQQNANANAYGNRAGLYGNASANYYSHQNDVLGDVIGAGAQVIGAGLGSGARPKA